MIIDEDITITEIRLHETSPWQQNDVCNLLHCILTGENEWKWWFLHWPREVFTGSTSAQSQGPLVEYPPHWFGWISYYFLPMWWSSLFFMPFYPIDILFIYIYIIIYIYLSFYIHLLRLHMLCRCFFIRIIGSVSENAFAIQHGMPGLIARASKKSQEHDRDGYFARTCWDSYLCP